MIEDVENLGKLRTEEVDPRFANLDQLTIAELCQVMNAADSEVPIAISKVLPAIENAINLIVSRLASGGRLIYIGAGTSGRLGVLDAAECGPTFSIDDNQVMGLIAGGDTALRNAIEGAEDSPESGEADVKKVNLSAADVLVGIAASGRTPYVLGALDFARKVGAMTVAVTCNPGSAVGSAADFPIEVDVGPEVLTGSTRLKSGTAQKLILNMISTITMVRLGKTYGNLMVDLRATNSKLRDRATRIVKSVTSATNEMIEKALEEASGKVKIAIVMIALDLDAKSAEVRLTSHGNRLRETLEHK
jgi:N-acetylmuramic acid 6-phosphate etherase